MSYSELHAIANAYEMLHGDKTINSNLYTEPLLEYLDVL